MVSNLCSCAEMNGIERVITKRAQELILLQSRGEDLVAACSTLPPEEAADLNMAVSIGVALNSCLPGLGTNGKMLSLCRPRRKRSTGVFENLSQRLGHGDPGACL